MHSVFFSLFFSVITRNILKREREKFFYCLLIVRVRHFQWKTMLEGIVNIFPPTIRSYLTNLKGLVITAFLHAIMD